MLEKFNKFTDNLVYVPRYSALGFIICLLLMDTSWISFYLHRHFVNAGFLPYLQYTPLFILLLIVMYPFITKVNKTNYRFSFTDIWFLLLTFSMIFSRIITIIYGTEIWTDWLVLITFSLGMLLLIYFGLPDRRKTSKSVA